MKGFGPGFFVGSVVAAVVVSVMFAAIVGNVRRDHWRLLNCVRDETADGMCWDDAQERCQTYTGVQ